MTQNNPSYPVTFRTLLQISGCHTVIAARMLSAFSGFVMIHTLVVLKLTGHLRVEGMLALVLAIKPFMLQYRWLLFLVGLVIYSLPINLWAMVELFRFEFMQFRLRAIAVPPKFRYHPPYREVSEERSSVLMLFQRQQQGFSQLKKWLLS